MPSADSTSPRSAFDVAVAGASPRERERLVAVRVARDIPSDAPEWDFYAVTVPGVRDALASELGDLAQRLAERDRSTAPRAAPPRIVVTAATVALILLALATTAAISWAAARSYETNRLAVTAPAVGQILATPGGRAALTLLRANGDGLAAELTACRRHGERGRTALTCTFWADGTALAVPQTVPAALADVALRAPLWPFLLLGAAALLARSVARIGARRADH